MCETPAREAARHALEGIVTRMGLADLDVRSGEGEEGAWVVEVYGPGADELAHGPVLDALQYLVNRMAGRGTGGEGLPVFVDADGYRARRSGELRETAHRLAEEVRRTGRSVSAGRLTPYERRLVHLAVAEEPDVVTRSDGEGRDRRLRVLPA